MTGCRSSWPEARNPRGCQRELLGIMKIVYILTVVVITRWYTFVETHHTAHLKQVTFSKLDFNKSDFPNCFSVCCVGCNVSMLLDSGSGIRVLEGQG